ncbi:MAG TPA: NADH-quinone oxidoreductase subunit M [Anaerolineae bacterium]|nr:NADH-quinone oxidoreductase subunit M [Anaerolineae bacterium]
MDLTSFPLTTLVTFFPLLGIPILLLLRREQEEQIKRAALVVSAITFVLSLGFLVGGFDFNKAGFQFQENQPWIPAWGINYHVGVDGISILLVLLTTLLMPIAILSSWTAIHDRLREYMIFMLLLETAMVGVFVALDLFLFYVFWEFSLVPMYFLVGIWGGPRRVYAAIKFFLYTMAGSILMLLAILWLGTAGGTFDLVALIAKQGAWVGTITELLLFIGFAAAFAIKVPLWPLHSWLPDAHVEAPTAGSVILAGVLLKLGTYGFLRFNLTLFPEASRQAAPVIAVLAVIGIIYGAIVSYPQSDVKKLVAYSSVSHLGFVMLGIFSLTPQGIQGAILQMVNHGLSTGALFLIVGFVYERKHTRELSAFGGLWKIMPIYGTIALIVALSSMGLPGLNGFVGEFTILLGSTASTAFGNPGLYTALAAVGIILAAVYILWMFQRMFMGEVSEENRKLTDLNRREIWVMAPLVILIFVIGLFPAPFFNAMSASVGEVVARVGGLIAGGH